MRKALICLTVAVGLVLGVELLASAETVRKILVIEKGTKDRVIDLVEGLGGTVVNELEHIEESLIVDIPVGKQTDLAAAREVLKAHDDEIMVFIPPWRRYEASVKKEEERRPKELEQYTGDDWGYDRIDVEEIHWPGLSRIVHQSSMKSPEDSVNIGFILMGAVGLVGAGLVRWRGRRGLFLGLTLVGLSSLVAGCAGGVVMIIEGAGVRVALLDTGIDFDHPDINANVNVALSRNCLTGTCVAGGDDDNGHGSWTGGIIAAERRNEADKPFDKKIGVAPKAELIAIKVCDAGGSCPSSAILAGMNYAISVGAKVANMSLGSGAFARGTLPTYCQPKPGDPTGGTGIYDPALRAMFVNNITLVVAAGNFSSAYNLGPGNFAALFASCRGTIAVAATSPADRMACTSFYTGFGEDVELAAPGEYVFSLDLMPPTWEGYMAGSGTSAAAPFVTGVAALLYSTGVNTPTAVRTRLLATADNVIQACGLVTPEPIVDAEEAVLGSQNGDN